MFEHKYLTESHLRGFYYYKYRAIDTSPLSNYVMHPTWNFTVKFIPTWVEPNLLTFLGFMCVVATTMVTWWYDHDWYACGGRPGHKYDVSYEIPHIVFTISSVLIFLAYNLDGLDGKQARRLGLSGPLGEMFDHGLDSNIVFLIPFCIFSIFGRDEFSVPMFRGYLIIASVVLNFYVIHWAKYNTRILHLPWGYDIAMWAASGLFLAAGLNGPAYFKMHVFGDVTFAQVLEVTIHVTGLLATFPFAVYHVYLSYKYFSGKNLSLMEAVRPWWSMIALMTLFTYWGLASPNDVLEKHPRVFLLLFGTVFANINSRLIVAEITDQRCELLNTLLWTTLAGIITSFYRPELEGIVLHTLLFTSLLVHVHYGVCVVRQMCDHFNLYCFTERKKSAPRKPNGRRKLNNSKI